MPCKGICTIHVAKKPIKNNMGRYESGQKRCTNCEVYVIWDGRACPCCGTPLRSKPRNSHGRNKLIFKNG